jgi:hypothetical protein
VVDFYETVMLARNNKTAAKLNAIKGSQERRRAAGLKVKKDYKEDPHKLVIGVDCEGISRTKKLALIQVSAIGY